SQRGQASVDRLESWYSNAIQIHTPIHASWLNQVEIYFSVLQRKVRTPNYFESLEELETKILAFQAIYEETAQGKTFRVEIHARGLAENAIQI
ncbi:MAG: transposase, partial [Deltaproteobacteria bacterium]|nr:transposase [Deltaproteobacteria bacterium]